MKIDQQIKRELKEFVTQKINQSKQKVKIISPYLLSSDELTGLRNQFSILRTAEIVNICDPSLLAGIVISFGTKVIDLSLKGELTNLKQLIYDIA